jgi:hypothetical protein
MASAKPAATTRRTSSPKGPKKTDGPEISPARWAGVALVIAAIIGAIVLAVISPSDVEPDTIPGSAATSPSPSPVASTLDTQLPNAQPRIVTPIQGPTAEYEIEVVVSVPAEELPKRKLALVILRGDDELARVAKPKTDGNVTVRGVRLVRDTANELTAALEGPGGFGPRSDPVVVTHDRKAPVLALTGPKNKEQTYAETILVTGTSEAGAEVLIKNETLGKSEGMVVGNAGTFKTAVRLKRGMNRIVVEATDAAGLRQSDGVRVERLDGRPAIKITAPDRVRKSDLPTTIKVVVEVTDAKGERVEGAEIYYSLGGPGRTTITETDVTAANGRSTWNPEVSRSDSPAADGLDLSVTVTSPQDETRVKDKVITVS